MGSMRAILQQIYGSGWSALIGAGCATIPTSTRRQVRHALVIAAGLTGLRDPNGGGRAPISVDPSVEARPADRSTDGATGPAAVRPPSGLRLRILVRNLGSAGTAGQVAPSPRAQDPLVPVVREVK